MEHDMKKYNGSCLCGYIQFIIEGALCNPHLCYCNMCQKWSGAPVVMWVDCSQQDMKYESGAPTLYRSSATTQRAFCNRCGSSLFAVNNDSDTICFVTSIFHEKNEIVPISESFKECRQSWMCAEVIK